jgi:hypothetical protein
MANPFRNDLMRRRYDDLVKAYHRGHANLFTQDGGRSRGCSMATDFWRGFDNSIPAARWDRASRDTLAWAAYRAGRACAQWEAAR